MFRRDRTDHVQRRTADHIAFGAHLVMFGLLWNSAVLDCVASEDHRLILGDHELAPGEPFSLEVGLPADGWLSAALATLERWSEDGRPLVVELTLHADGAGMRASDGETAATFDLLGVMGRRPPV